MALKSTSTQTSGTTTEVAASLITKRMNVVDLAAQGAVGALTVTSQPANGRALVYGSGLVAIDLNDVTSTTNLTIVCEDANTDEFQINGTVSATSQSKGWYVGKHLSYPLSGGQYDLLPGEGSYQVYLTKGTATWDIASIAVDAGVSEGTVTGSWLAGQYPTYGAASNNSLDASSGEAGELLYNHVNNVGATFYLERGFDYTNLDPKFKYGESCTYPFRISSYGTGDRPDTLGKTFNFSSGPTTRFFVLEECHPTSVMAFNTGGAAFVFHKCLISYPKPPSEGETGGISVSNQMGLMTFENNAVYDMYRSAPRSGSSTQWAFSEIDKTVGIYVANTNDLLFKGNFLDYNGWRAGYDDDGDFSAGQPQPPTDRSHNIYVFPYNGVTYRENISCRPASQGVKNSSPGYFENNLFLGCPIGHNNLENSTTTPQDFIGFMCDEVVTVEDALRTTNFLPTRQGLGLQESSYEGSMIRLIAIHEDGPGAAPQGLDINRKGAGYAVDDCMEYDWTTNTGVSGLTTATLDALTIGDFTDTKLTASGSDYLDLIAHYRTLEDFAGEAKEAIAYFQDGFETAGKTNFGKPVHSGSPETISYAPDSQGRTPGLRWETRLDWSTLYLPEDGDTVNLNGFTVYFYENNLALNTLNLGPGGGVTASGGHLSVTSAMTTGAGGGTMKTLYGGRITVPGYTDSEGLAVTVEGGFFAFAGTVSGPCSVTVGLGLIPYSQDAKSITNKGYCVLGEGGDTFTVASGETLTIEGGGLAGTDATSGTFNITVASGGTLHFAEKQDDGGSYLVGEIREFRSGRNGTTEPNCTFNITLASGSNVTMDTTNMASNTYDVVVCDTLTDNGATLASGITVVSGTTLRLTI